MSGTGAEGPPHLVTKFPTLHAPRVEVRTLYPACYLQLITVLESVSSVVWVDCLRYDDIGF